MGKTINQQPPFSGNPFENTYFVLDQLNGQEYTTCKISGEQLAMASGLVSFPTDTLTDSDIGKLVMNKAGKAVVANRDTPRPAQAGQWTITVNAVFEMPVPTTVDFTLTGLPVDGDYIVLGLQRFVFKTSPTSNYDIQIGTDIPTTVANTSTLFNARYPNQWTASNDGVNKVSVVFNAIYNTGLANPMADLTFGFYYNMAQPDQIDAVSEQINLNVSTPGNVQHIREFNTAFLSYNGHSLSYFDASDPNNNIPNGAELFGVKWVADVNDQATNIAYAINSKFSGKLLATVVNNIITVTALSEPNSLEAADMSLAGRAPFI